MGLIGWFHSIFSKKEKVPEQMDIAAKIMILKLGQDLHADTITELLDRMKHAEEFRSLVANACTNFDSRLDSLEKMTGFLYEKAAEQEGRIDSVEESNTSSEFAKLVASTTEEN